MKKVISICLMLVLFLSLIPTIVFAADCSYSKYSAPSNSGDYAYWNGSRVVRASGTSVGEVKWMQASLNFCKQSRGLTGFNYLSVDGSFGPASKAATLIFQKKYGLSQDGSFGPSTIQKMKQVLNSTNNTTGSSKTLSINWSNINGTGYQNVSGPCYCYALAYCRDIIDGKIHSWTEYSEKYLSSEKRYSYTAVPSKAGYSKKTSTSEAIAFKAIYEQIANGKPVIANVTGGRSSGCHYVAVVGYVNVTNTDSLKANNFLIIDSALKSTKTAAENMGSIGYSLRKSGGAYAWTTKN